MELKSVCDQRQDEISFAFPPQRIISLVPSQTELLYDLGLTNEVVGITKFCIHPSIWQKEKKIIGGTKNFWFDEIDALNPDLIIGNKEENYKEGIVSLKEKYPVWMSDIVSFEDALVMINALGDITCSAPRAQVIVDKIQTSFNNLKKINSKSVLYLIWKKPWMAAGSQTFINSMLSAIGLINCLHNRPRYPELTEDDIRALAPELIFLSSEPFPFREQHLAELKQIVPNAHILLVDGEMFSWYGSRLIKAPDYFNSLV